MLFLETPFCRRLDSLHCLLLRTAIENRYGQGTGLQTSQQTIGGVVVQYITQMQHFGRAVADSVDTIDSDPKNRIANAKIKNTALNLRNAIILTHLLQV